MLKTTIHIQGLKLVFLREFFWAVAASMHLISQQRDVVFPYSNILFHIIYNLPRFNLTVGFTIFNERQLISLRLQWLSFLLHYMYFIDLWSFYWHCADSKSAIRFLSVPIASVFFMFCFECRYIMVYVHTCPSIISLWLSFRIDYIGFYLSRNVGWSVD